MTEEEWRETAPAQAVLSFTIFMGSVLNLIIAGKLGGLLVKGLGAIARWVGKKELPPTFDPERDEALLHALLVIASWSAFEACVADFIKGLLSENPQLLQNQDLLKLKVPVSDLLHTRDDERLTKVYRAIWESLGRKAGADRYEDIFKFVGLSAQVPRIFKDNLYNAQMVRNVWAHNAGTADDEFVLNAPHLGFERGELVSISNQQVSDYVTTTLIYASIVCNRQRALHGLGPMPLSDNVKSSPLTDAYRELYRSEGE